MPAQPAISIVFTAEGRAHGSGGCNRFTGGYNVSGNALRFGQVGSTMMACPPPAMELEHRFHAALVETRGWRIEDRALLLTSEAGVTLLRFTPES
jgi:heat shock protein HslJ